MATGDMTSVLPTEWREGMMLLSARFLLLPAETSVSFREICIQRSSADRREIAPPGNIMMQDGELMIIDMTEMTTGPAIYDIINVYRDIVAAPRLSPKSIEASMGLPAETIKKIGDDFFALYTGLDDLELLNEYYAKQELLYAFNVCLTVGIGPEKIRNNASKILDRQLRKTVIPNEATLRELLQNL
jgi:hypothetical protein